LGSPADGAIDRAGFDGAIDTRAHDLVDAFPELLDRREASGWNDQYPWPLCDCHSVVRPQPRGCSCAEQWNPTCALRAADANKAGTSLEPDEMMWHVVFAEPGQLPRSRAARSRDAAIHVACELLAAGCDVRRVIEPSGSFIERAELDEHYDDGHFPGLTRPVYRPELAIPLRPSAAATAEWVTFKSP
jgi:hypothetical protein